MTPRHNSIRTMNSIWKENKRSYIGGVNKEVVGELVTGDALVLLRRWREQLRVLLLCCTSRVIFYLHSSDTRLKSNHWEAFCREFLWYCYVNLRASYAATSVIMQQPTRCRLTFPSKRTAAYSAFIRQETTVPRYSCSLYLTGPRCICIQVRVIHKHQLAQIHIFSVQSWFNSMNIDACTILSEEVKCCLIVHAQSEVVGS